MISMLIRHSSFLFQTGKSKAGSEFAGTVELMLALDYVIRKAMELGKPVAINLSFGNVYGSHVPYTRGILGLNRS